jgi:hypothetical protein
MRFNRLVLLGLLVLSPGEARAAPEVSPAVKSGAWAGAVVAVLAGALALKFRLDVMEVDKDLQPFRRFPCGGQMCNFLGQVSMPLRPADLGYVKAKRDDRERLQRFAVGSLAVSGLAAVASGLLFWEWHRQATAAEAQTALVPLLAGDHLGISLIRRW